jgi:hypothetical protein
MCKIEVKNKFELDDVLDFLNPTESWQEEVKSIKRITNINRANDTEIDKINIKDENLVNESVAHPGSFDVWINCSKNP